ncbi:MAG: hypothetical protein SFZ23_14115, partial [Planctomycetota bacterium]|nr:hypothetical protein [Planctomycetota bacterium]
MKHQLSLVAFACAIPTVVVRANPTPPASPPPPVQGLDFVTVGDPGNRGANRAEVDYLYDNYQNIGAVGYSFQIMRTNLAVGQWIEFVRAYAPFYTPRNGDWMPLTGFEITRNPIPGGGHEFNVWPGSDNYAAQVPWEMSARYCNWLHNDKRLA